MFKSRYNHFPNRWNSKYKYKFIIGAQEETVNRSLTIALLILQFFHQRKILPKRVPL